MNNLAFALSSSASAPPSPLSLVLARLRGADGAVVFDLDSTLLDNRPRQALIVREYGEQVGEPAFSSVMASHFDSWDLRAAARNANIPEPVIAAHADELRRFWRDRFFTSSYCQYDVVVPGAVEFVREVSELGRVIYLTGRPPEMKAGTLESLKSLGFPAPDGARVVLLIKPDPDLHDDHWKVQAVEEANRHGPVLAAFDNEPTHINGYRLAWPKALCVRVATDHSGRPVPLAPGISEVRSFLR